ncbi:MAG TPA: sugar ABC transporter permease, partial [Clostridiales bacterium]|nr:sugar ABC transporter permease [Clostridiales bacterium]
MAQSKLKQFNKWDALIYAVIGILSVVFLYPIWYCLITSISSGDALNKNIILLWPMDLTLESYKYVFTSDANIFFYYRNSIFYAVAGTALSLTVTAMMAYPFIIKDFIGKRFLNVYMVITMFFSGGLLP